MLFASQSLVGFKREMEPQYLFDLTFLRTFELNAEITMNPLFVIIAVAVFGRDTRQDERVRDERDDSEREERS